MINVFRDIYKSQVSGMCLHLRCRSRRSGKHWLVLFPALLHARVDLHPDGSLRHRVREASTACHAHVLHVVSKLRWLRHSPLHVTAPSLLRGLWFEAQAAQTGHPWHPCSCGTHAAPSAGGSNIATTRYHISITMSKHRPAARWSRPLSHRCVPPTTPPLVPAEPT